MNPSSSLHERGIFASTWRFFHNEQRPVGKHSNGAVACVAPSEMTRVGKRLEELLKTMIFRCIPLGNVLQSRLLL